MKGSINSIESFSTIDGPGIRSVVFMNGCSLRCKFCHNPETWQITDLNYTVDELVNELLKYKSYFGTLGGVTLSGGEPLLQSEFLNEVCIKLHENNINVALDTTGIGSYEKILDNIDLIIYDIKDITENRYKDLTGGNIKDALTFVKYAENLNIPFIIRLVVIPGVNDTKEYMDELNKYIKKYFNKIKIIKFEFKPFHQMAKDKYQKLGIKYSYQDKEEMDVEKTKELYEYFDNIYK